MEKMTKNSVMGGLLEPIKTVLFGNQCCVRQCCARPRCNEDLATKNMLQTIMKNYVEMKISTKLFFRNYNTTNRKNWKLSTLTFLLRVQVLLSIHISGILKCLY